MKYVLIILLLYFQNFCSDFKNPIKSDYQEKDTKILIQEAGRIIVFPNDSEQLFLFETTVTKISNSELNLKAPATVIGKVKSSDERGQPPIVLFASTDLTSAYASYLQNLVLIQLAKTNYNRTKDLYENQAATGKELNDSSSQLLQYQSTLSETEAKLRREGFNPKVMKSAPVGTVWLISDLPESELNLLYPGLKCDLEFTGYPSEVYHAKIDSISEVLNTDTRKARIRLVMQDNKEKIRPGMYGKATFNLKHNGLMIPKNAVYASNTKYYVFVKLNHNTFEKREISVSTENQEMIEIASGLSEGENIVFENVYLLKGISSGN
jgi:multidrug efflux pump subunit AcrA (membrane-fusion protein)